MAGDGGNHGKDRPTKAPEDAERQSRKPRSSFRHGSEYRTGRDSHHESASGANLRNVWTIPTHGFSAAHFATFPPRSLVEPCIKAGTSEHGCCAECGAPWGRVVVTGYTDTGSTATVRKR